MSTINTSTNQTSQPPTTTESANATASANTSESTTESTDTAESASTSESSSTTESTDTAKSTSTTDSANEASTQVDLSSRASKMQKLNEEFFPGGPKTVTITPEFIQRLSEYGLISSEEAAKLDTTTSDTQQAHEPLDQISSFIDDLTDKTLQQDPQSSLINTLSKAKTVIDGFGISASAMNTDIKTIIAELNLFKQSEQGLLLSNEDKSNLEKLDMALQIADQMNPNNNSSQQLSSYVDIYNQAQE